MYMAKEFSLYQRIFEADCVKFGEFKLKSGIISPVYVDFRVLVSKPELLREVGQALADRARQIGCDRIAGIPYAGVPLGVAAALAGDIPMIYPRKEAKQYGTGKLIEGEFQPGDRVLVIDDIITDGASKIEAIEALKEAGLVVTDVLVILDREQGGAKKLADAGYTLHSLGTLSEVLDALVAAGKVDVEMRANVAEFIAANQFA
jgi:uridine monophosphate synthetase